MQLTYEMTQFSDGHKAEYPLKLSFLFYEEEKLIILLMTHIPSEDALPYQNGRFAISKSRVCYKKWKVSVYNLCFRFNQFLLIIVLDFCFMLEHVS